MSKFFLNYILERVLKRNKNFLCVVCGDTGSGKSYTTLKFGEALDPEFDINRVAFTPAQFMTILGDEKLHRGNFVMYDECGVGMDSRSWYSTTNKMINYILQTFRHENLIVFFTVPDISFIDSRARKLFHCYIECLEINDVHQYCIIKPLLIQNNPALAKIYRKYPRHKGRKIKRIRVGLPSLGLRKSYEPKKRAFTKELKEGVEATLKVENPGIPTTKLTPLEIKVKELRNQGNSQAKVADMINNEKGTKYVQNNISKIEKSIRAKGYSLVDLRDKRAINKFKKGIQRGY